MKDHAPRHCSVRNLLKLKESRLSGNICGNLYVHMFLGREAGRKMGKFLGLA